MITRISESRADRLRRRADKVVAAGAFDQAIVALTRLAARGDRPDVDRQLVALRHRAFLESTHAAGLATWPPEPSARLQPDPRTGMVEIERDELTSAVVREGILRHGSLIVRGLFDPDASARLRDSIRCSFDAHDRYFDAPIAETGDDAWFSPFDPAADQGFEPIAREWVRSGGGVLAADSPRGLRLFLDECERAGVIDVLAGHLGERPALSVLKTTLRCVPPDVNSTEGWHQDGAFLGNSIRTVNVWVALSPCGVTAPSLDIVPGRLERLMATGTPGAAFDWSVARDLVDEVCPTTGPVRGIFGPGDAILFDEMNLHRTAATPEMTDDRYAIEAWFFAPSAYPMSQIPLAV